MVSGSLRISWARSPASDISSRMAHFIEACLQWSGSFLYSKGHVFLFALISGVLASLARSGLRISFNDISKWVMTVNGGRLAKLYGWAHEGHAGAEPIMFRMNVLDFEAGG